MYEIKQIERREELSKGNPAEVSIYNWGGGYRPKTTAVVCYWKDHGFLVRMACEEADPRSVVTEQNSGVCRDSCLEFFANFRPDKPDSGYLNFECNSIGSLLCCYGPDRYQRKTVLELGCAHPKAEPFRSAAEWGWELLIPLELLRQLYGKAVFSPGDIIKGNFYKCGDDTAQPHYGSYTAISSEQPDFHRPECFAEMVITA